MDLFNKIHPDANDDLRTICEGSAPFNENDYLDLTSYSESNQCHSAAYDLPDYDENMFAFDATTANNGGLANSAGESPEELEHDGSTVGVNNATREILQQFFARFDALEDKIEKFQESQIKGLEEMRREMAGSQIKGVEEMRREMAGLRQIIRAEVLLETPSKG